MRHRTHSGKRLWWFAVLAVLFHATLLVMLRSEVSAPEPEPPLAGKFLKRLPLRQQVLQRHLSVPTRVRPLRRATPMPSAFVRATAPVSRQMASAHVVGTPSSYALPRRPFKAGIGVRGRSSLRSKRVAVTVAASDQVDLRLELTDTEALDTGRYRALVVEDPGNPRGLKGFVRLAAVGIHSAMAAVASKPEEFRLDTPPRPDNLDVAVDWRPESNLRALDELALELEAHTQLAATVEADGLLHEDDWLRSPFVLITAPTDFVPTEQEVTNLGRYLTGGGFAYVETVGWPFQGHLAFGRSEDLLSLRHLVEESLTRQGLHRGVDWDIEPLGLEHPLFSCFHEIQVLPLPYWMAAGVVVLNRFGWAGSSPYPLFWDERRPPLLEGIYVQGRLAGIYSQQNYRDLWARRVERSYEGLSDFKPLYSVSRMTGDAALRLGTNVVVYALTQEGSLARQYVARQ